MPRRGPQDIIRNPPGVTVGRNLTTLKDAFELFITPDILDIIMRETNREANRVCTEWNAQHQNSNKQWVPLSLPELKAFIGLLITAGVNRAHMEPLTQL